MKLSIYALVVASVALVGCTPAGPASTPIPSVAVPTCRPLDGSAPAPCTQQEYDDLEAQWALFDEAEAVLRRYRAEVKRQEVDWQLREMTPVLEETTMGTFRGFEEDLIRQDREAKSRLVSAPAEISWVRPLPGVTRRESVTALEFCVDASNERYLLGDDKVEQAGVVGVRRYFFAREGGQLKILTAEANKVESC